MAHQEFDPYALLDALRPGDDVDVQRAGRVHAVEPYRAVVVGSAVYAGRWRSDAMRLLRRPQLNERAVWLFGSGPVGEDTGDPAQRERWTRPERVGKMVASIGVREHVVLGGKVAEDAGFIRKKMARKIPPELRDRRDWTQIEVWAQAIADALRGQSVVGDS